MEPNTDSAPISAHHGPVRRSDVPFVALDGYVSKRTVEDRVGEAVTLVHERPLIYFDLSRALQFDVVGLLYLISVVAARHETGQQTRFCLPKDNLARHLLRLWDFPKTVTAVTRTPFHQLVERDDWEYIGDNRTTTPPRSSATSPRDSVLAYLVERRAFGLTPYRHGGKPDLERLVQDQMAHWSNYALASLVGALLPSPPADFVRVVVREMMVNAVQNSSPSIVVVGSQLDLLPYAETDDPTGLSLAIWHDGPATVDRLSACAERVGDGRWEQETIGRSAEPGIVALCRTTVETFGGYVAAHGGSQSAVIPENADDDGKVGVKGTVMSVFGEVITVRIPINDG